MQKERLVYLFRKRFSGSITTGEEQELSAIINDPAGQDLVEECIQQFLEHPPVSAEMDPEKIEETLARIFQAESVNKLPVAPVHRIHFLRTSWFRYAAAILLMAGAATIAVVVSSDRQESPSKKGVHALSADIRPGTNRAVLTVDNKSLDLASDKTGINVGNTITYSDGEKITEAGELLQLTTPRGGQYQAVLPDGSKVWLNAASSIQFPSKFHGNQRVVEVTGEVYLEIARNLKQPFSVHVNGANIQVLGTSFNVNAYEDENLLKTTLIDGSVKVLANGRGSVLKPGQQAVVGEGNVAVQSANIEQTLAWKRGVFQLDGASLTEIMRQLSRWYDIEVAYERGVPDIQLGGEMKRDLNLSQVLSFLDKLGVKYRLEGKRLIVL